MNLLSMAQPSHCRGFPMCGRFEIHSAIEIILRIFQVDSITFDLMPSYNIAPGQDVPIVVNDNGNRLVLSRWGFVPSWSKELKTGYKMINARVETVATLPSFRDAFANHRCLVPADGFFEWKKTDKARLPRLIRLRSGRPMGFAGLYNAWHSPEGEEVRTCTIITTSANEAVKMLHDRMPAILPENAFDQWLDPREHDAKKLLPLLKPCAPDEIEVYPVTPKMNSSKYNDPENIKPIPE